MEKFIAWLESLKAPLWVDVLRIVAGIAIVYKGIVFVSDFQSFTGEISTVGWIYIAAHLGHAIIFVHLVCGPVLLFGAYTRVMSLLNIPILAGAVVFNYQKMMVSSDTEFPLTVGILVFLIITFFYGGGEWSLDYKRKA